MIAQKNTRKRRLFRAKEEEMKRRISPKKTQQPSSSVARVMMRGALLFLFLV
jgi:hypothetical protein